MNSPIRYRPPPVSFDDQLAQQLDNVALQPFGFAEATAAPIDRRSPFEGYSRTLTPEGGILIQYQDLNLGLPLIILRYALCAVVTCIGVMLILAADTLFSARVLLALLAVVAVDWLILKYKIRSHHSVEIRPDCMIIDGEDVFLAEDIGENYPELLDVPGKQDQMRICTRVGTRFVELMTANRTDANDRTPEVLAAHLKDAMEQLWARREVTFPELY